MNTIKEKWDLFEPLALSEVTNKIQRQEMKKAFYAGAQSMMNIQLNLDEDISDDAYMGIIEGCRDEFQMFVEQLKNGLA